MRWLGGDEFLETMTPTDEVKETVESFDLEIVQYGEVLR